MPKRPCLRCGALTSGSYCPSHQPKRPSRQTRGRGGGWAADRFRRAVLERAGYRCEVVEAGRRCEVRGAAQLQAHHMRPLGADGTSDPATNGVAVCRRHHEALERGLP